MILSKNMDHMKMNRMNNQMMMNGMNNQMMMNGMNNQMMMNRMSNTMMRSYPTMMYNTMMMNNQMMMNRMYNTMMTGRQMNMMTKKQKELYKQQLRYHGYLTGKKMAEEKKRREGAKNPQTVTEDIQNSIKGEFTIRFNKGGNITNIKMRTDCMLAELINAYYEKTNNQGPFIYKGRILNPEDSSSLIEAGMRNGDEIIVGNRNVINNNNNNINNNNRINIHNVNFV